MADILRPILRDIHRPILGSILGCDIGGTTPVTYLLRDDFTTDDAAPLTTPRTAEPGPGTLNASEVNGTLAVSSDWLEVRRTGANAWTTLGLVEDGSQARAAGVPLVVQARLEALGYLQIGFKNTNTFDQPEHAVYYFPDGSLHIKTGSGTNIAVTPAGTLTASDVIEQATVLRASGDFHLYKPDGGSWTLLYLQTNGTDSTLHAIVNSYSFDVDIDYIRVPDATYLPIPLASDSFDRGNNTDLNATGGTDGAGHPEANGGSGKAWTELSGDWQITSNKLGPTGSVPAQPRFVATVDAGEADVVIEATLNSAATGTSPGIAARFDASTGFIFNINAGANTIYIYEWNGSGFSLIGSVAGVTINISTDYRVVVIADDEALTMVFDDSTALPYASAVAGKTKTTHGFRVDASDSTVFDDFVVWPRTPSNATTLDTYK